eukprot:Lithocolla_globosa_v1_NODE_5701_length_1199_cov_185.523601.p2 type:complete len:109 gc:universal NODE_5701_length_1199_cov_185.523601:985-659(-)
MSGDGKIRSEVRNSLLATNVDQIVITLGLDDAHDVVLAGVDGVERDGRGRVAILEDDDQNVIPNVPFAFKLLILVLVEGQKCADVEHNLVPLPLGVDGVCSSQVTNDI